MKGSLKEGPAGRVPLTEVINSADLPGLIAEYFPESGAKPNTEGAFKSVWRGDKHPSGSVYRNGEAWLYKDHATGEAGNAWHFLTQVVGLSNDEALKTLNGNGKHGKTAPKPIPRVVATYDYQDEHGHLLFQVERLEPKGFRQRHSCPESRSGFTYGLGGNKDKCGCALIEPVLYRLPKVLAQVQQGGAVYIVEGEKDVHTLEALGKVTTCNPMGALKWREEYALSLDGAHVVLIPDNDEVGYKHMRQVALSLKGRVKSLRLLILPALPPKGDVSDWLKTHTSEEFAQAVKAAPVWLADAEGETLETFVQRTFVSFVSESSSASEAIETWEDPKPLPPNNQAAPALPAELIPEPLRNWLTDIAERASVPLEIPAAAAIVAASAAIGRSIGIHPKERDSWLVVPNLWGGVVGRPGLMKTALISEATKPLRRLEAKAAEEHERERAGHEARRGRLQLEIDTIKAAYKAALKKGTGDPEALEAELEAATKELNEISSEPRRYLLQDPTVEKLGELLRSNPRGLLLLRDELAGWLRTLERPGREGDREFYLETWNGTGDYTFDRIGRGTVRIPHVCLSLFGGIQPGKLSHYINEALEGGKGADGLLQRLQVVVWPERLGEWRNVDREPDKEARNRAHRIFEVLATYDAAALGLQPDDDGIGVLRFSSEAQVLFNEWRAELEQRLRSDELSYSPAFESHLSKYRSLMPSLALVFYLIALADGASDSSDVGLEYAALAAAWCEYLETHAKRLYAGELNRVTIAAHALLEKIKDGKVSQESSVRDIYRNHWEGLTDAEVVREALVLMAECNLVRIEERSSGGRPTQVILLHPDLRGN